MVEIDNTAIAFADKSNADLKRAAFIFKLLKKPWRVKFGKALLDFALKAKLPIAWIIKPTVFKHFCGGETLKECEQSIDQLAKARISSTLDYSAEGQETEESFDDTTTIIFNIIEKAAKDKNIAHAVFKPTGIARLRFLEMLSEGEILSNDEEQELLRVEKRFTAICRCAASHNVPLMIDAEESWIQPAIDMLVEQDIEDFNHDKPIIYNTLQLYRKDRLDYMIKYCNKAWDMNVMPAFKLVRGAYLEKERERAKKMGYESPVHDFKKDTDEDFDQAIKYCLDNIEKMAVCIATHNENSVLYAISYMELLNIEPDHPHVSFSQLYGMSDNISYNLAANGYNVSKYVPYGPLKLVMPYLIRRAEENTSVAGQTNRELEMIRKELKRRKSLGKAEKVLEIYNQ